MALLNELTAVGKPASRIRGANPVSYSLCAHTPIERKMRVFDRHVSVADNAGIDTVIALIYHHTVWVNGSILRTLPVTEPGPAIHHPTLKNC